MRVRTPAGLLAAHKLFGMFDMLAEAIEEERRERVTIRRGRPSKKAKALAEAESLVEVAEGFETERARKIARRRSSSHPTAPAPMCSWPSCRTTSMLRSGSIASASRPANGPSARP